jgi:hypothetical protein
VNDLKRSLRDVRDANEGLKAELARTRADVRSSTGRAALLTTRLQLKQVHEQWRVAREEIKSTRMRVAPLLCADFHVQFERRR